MLVLFNCDFRYCLIIFTLSSIRMKKYCLLVLYCFSTTLTLLKAQPCTTLGQTPSSAFPVCGGAVFNQTTVPNCGGTAIPVPPCGTGYDDRNPLFYKFTCFKTGTLGFTITPIQMSDDFDWQIFDVTGKSPNAIYTDATCFVTCSWSGITGITGANSSGTAPHGCLGNSQPPIVSMPTITQGKNYILLISNFSASNKGYNLAFGGGTAVITDSTPPAIQDITNNCIGDKIYVKLNKKMRCNTVAANASDFTISSNPTISNLEAVGCSSGFDTDSLVITLATPLTTGNYTVALKNGTDGNTILDLCDVGIPVGSSKVLSFTGAFIPTLLDSITPSNCNPSFIDVVFKRGMLCSSIATNGSDFTITGPSTVSIANASIICTNSLTTTVRINFTTPINVLGNYVLNVALGSDGNTLLNECGVPTPIGTNKTFNVPIRPNPSFTYVAKETCKADTLQYFHNGNGNTIKWEWSFDGLPTVSNAQNPTVIYTSFLTRSVQLKVSNNVCADSITQNIPITNHSLSAQIVVADTTCPLAGTNFIDGSTGLINSWKWAFGNGNTSNAQNPTAQFYAITPNNVSYTATLKITNTVGCVDSTSKVYVVKPSTPALLDGISTYGCSPNKITIFFTAPMRCNSIALNGSDFVITGPGTVLIDSAKGICTAGFGRFIEIYLKDSIRVPGTYKIQLQRGSDGNILINDCGLESLPAFLNFKVNVKPNANFTPTVLPGCKADTLQLFHNGLLDVDRWRWYLNDSLISDKQQTKWHFNYNSNKVIKLIVLNSLCGDSISKPVQLIFDSLIARINLVNNLVCPNEFAIFRDSSIGNITNYTWQFGNGVTSSIQHPTPQLFNTPTSTQILSNTLKISNLKGCTDSAVQLIKVVPNCLVEVATAFTPNGDGLNDFLYPINAYKAINLQFRVFNRFGQLIFESRDFSKKWDGTVQGQKQQPGTYVWTLEYTDKDTGKSVTTKGFSVLIR
jgi:gliding motility-associated-like protein